MIALVCWRRLVAPVASVALSQALYHACRIDGQPKVCLTPDWRCLSCGGDKERDVMMAHTLDN